VAAGALLDAPGHTLTNTQLGNVFQKQCPGVWKHLRSTADAGVVVSFAAEGGRHGRGAMTIPHLLASDAHLKRRGTRVEPEGLAVSLVMSRMRTSYMDAAFVQRLARWVLRPGREMSSRGSKGG
jgi:hypothetical protein